MGQSILASSVSPALTLLPDAYFDCCFGRKIDVQTGTETYEPESFPPWSNSSPGIAQQTIRRAIKPAICTMVNVWPLFVVMVTAQYSFFKCASALSA